SEACTIDAVSEEFHPREVLGQVVSLRNNFIRSVRIMVPCCRPNVCPDRAKDVGRAIIGANRLFKFTPQLAAPTQLIVILRLRLNDGVIEKIPVFVSSLVVDCRMECSGSRCRRVGRVNSVWHNRTSLQSLSSQKQIM